MAILPGVDSHIVGAKNATLYANRGLSSWLTLNTYHGPSSVLSILCGLTPQPCEVGAVLICTL